MSIMKQTIKKLLGKLGKIRSRVFRKIVCGSIDYINGKKDLSKCIITLCGAMNIRMGADNFNIKFESGNFNMSVDLGVVRIIKRVKKLTK